MNHSIILTGTHLTPALALAEKLQKNSFQIHYLGRDNAFDQDLIQKYHLSFIPIKAPKFKRYKPLASFFSAPQLLYSFYQSIKAIKLIKPDVVVSFGGFVAFPVCLAAKIYKTKIILHEQTFKAGLANKLSAFLADTIAISWPSSFKYFPRHKTVLTGNPVRVSLHRLKSTSTNPKTIYISGGSQGSSVINQVILKIIVKLLKNYQIFHQYGLAQDQHSWQEIQNFYHRLPQNLKSGYTLKKWFSLKELSQIYKQADLIISRAGVNTITEALFLKKRTILIPLPYTQKNEQLHNAIYLKKHGLAIIIDQSKLSSKTLLFAIKKALKNLPLKKDLSSDQRLIATATENLFNLIQ